MSPLVVNHANGEGHEKGKKAEDTGDRHFRIFLGIDGKDNAGGKRDQGQDGCQCNDHGMASVVCLILEFITVLLTLLTPISKLDIVQAHKPLQKMVVVIA